MSKIKDILIRKTEVRQVLEVTEKVCDMLHIELRQTSITIIKSSKLSATFKDHFAEFSTREDHSESIFPKMEINHLCGFQ